MNKNILFLGYGENETSLINELKKKGCNVHSHNNNFFEPNKYDLVITFGYRHLITQKVLKETKRPIINLHISYLPWNRGAHPSFWSFMDQSPSGVTIHEINEGIDTGPIIYQKYVYFDKKEVTFNDTYNRLIVEIEKLFFSKIENIISQKYVTKPQISKGTFQKKVDLPSTFSGWDANISYEIKRLYNLRKMNTKRIN